MGQVSVPMVANACVEVYTSIDDQGTLNHLMIGTDTQAFAVDLKALIGRENIPTALAGGDSWSNESNRLISGLKQNLVAQGFDVVATDLGGVCSRKSIMFTDRVEFDVEDHQSGNPIFHKRVLYFSK